MEGQIQNNDIRPHNDKEYCEIKDYVDFVRFVKFMKDRRPATLRLPLNNPEAYKYLRWLNNYFIDDSCYLNYLLNIWDETFKKPVRPPTAREVAIFNSRRIVEIVESAEIKDADKDVFIDSEAEFIRDAYQYWSYPIWIASGLAGSVMKWGTFEDNVKEGDEFLVWEEWNK